MTTASSLARKRGEINYKGNSMCKRPGGIQPISGGSKRGQEKEATGNVVTEEKGGGTGRDRA